MGEIIKIFKSFEKEESSPEIIQSQNNLECNEEHSSPQIQPNDFEIEFNYLFPQNKKKENIEKIKLGDTIRYDSGKLFFKRNSN